jgi:Spy/CpxP family protein refolding chaperone
MTKFLRFGRWPLAAAVVLVPVAALAGAGMHAWHMHQPPQSEEELRERLSVGAGMVYGVVDATPEQQASIDAILDDAAASLWDRHDEREARHAEIRAILTADTVDRKALEGVRREVVAAFDDVSQDVVGWVADAAEVLSPEQRREIAAHHDALVGGLE